jgi:hypothetical protein
VVLNFLKRNRAFFFRLIQYEAFTVSVTTVLLDKAGGGLADIGIIIGMTMLSAMLVVLGEEME